MVSPHVKIFINRQAVLRIFANQTACQLWIDGQKYAAKYCWHLYSQPAARNLHFLLFRVCVWRCDGRGWRARHVTRVTWPAWHVGWTAAINSGGRPRKPSLVCDGQWRVIFLWRAVSLLWTAPGFCGGQEDITKYSSWGLLNIHLCLGRYSKRPGVRAFVLCSIRSHCRQKTKKIGFRQFYTKR